MAAIGIDLGTTNSCVAVYRNKRVEIIANDQGSRITPSWVSFTDSQKLVGEAAKEEASMNCENTLFQIKRLIGRKFNDPTVQKDMKRWGFEIVKDGDRPKLQVTYKEEVKTFFPEEISAMILAELKEAAEAYMGGKITDAVITVPAYFNDAQRTATRDAGRIAGLNVLSMINEPTAAAIAYGLDNKSNDERTVLIFDLGGGTFDVTIATIEEQIFDVKATGGNTHLGGEDFDNRMVDHFIKEFSVKHGVDMSSNKRAVSRLRVACEAAKRKLSVSTNAKVQLDGLFMGLDFKSNISQAKFEAMNADLFDSTLDTVKNVLSDAKMNKKQIDDIVLVGGSTRIPKIRQLLQDFFEGKEICRTINPDEAVAYGAAALAENIRSGGSETKERFQLMDVTPLSVGTDVRETDMFIVIPRNTKIPTRKTESFITSSDNQTALNFKVYEGERPCIHDNHHLGTFVLRGIPPAPKGVASVQSVFEIDRSGILTVTAYDPISGSENKIKITNDEKQMAKNEIDKMVL
uniref:heat shock cognate 71 kDa protein-like isoform X2 n=1 Tax=Styela clava TaxID=7725 RepID=UPI001939CE16|nr:heat shock cognate 71 kDa protein-like isoform X2 [Styela clava]